MRFAVDPWDPSYGSGLDAELGSSTAEIVADVEVPTSRWAPLARDPRATAPGSVLFVDGVRRVDAQIWIDETAGSAPGLCASYAAGVVHCRAQGAHLASAVVRRGLFTTAARPADVHTGAGVFGAVHTAHRADVAPMQLLSLALQRDLATAEILAAGQARDAVPGDDDLLVVDGPLHGRQHLPRVLGFVKSHRSDYLPTELGEVVGRLGPGERTPVFTLQGSWERHTWYLRLPCRPSHAWAGVVRVEAPAELTVEAVSALASTSQVMLPRFASVEYKDSRAPQNLYPIAGLERELRRRLGHEALLYRALLKAAAREADGFTQLG